MKKHDSEKETCRLFLYLLLKVDLCLPAEMISFVKQIFPESNSQLHTGSASAQGLTWLLLLGIEKAIVSVGFTFH